MWALVQCLQLEEWVAREGVGQDCGCSPGLGWAEGLEAGARTYRSSLGQSPGQVHLASLIRSRGPEGWEALVEGTGKDAPRVNQTHFQPAQLPK